MTIADLNDEFWSLVSKLLLVSTLSIVSKPSLVIDGSHKAIARIDALPGDRCRVTVCAKAET
jgi:hypothetical protein